MACQCSRLGQIQSPPPGRSPLAGGSPPASLNCSRTVTNSCWLRSGIRATIRAISRRRRWVAFATTAVPSSVNPITTSRREAGLIRLSTKPVATNRSIIRVPVEGSTPSCSVNADKFIGPRELSNTNNRNCDNVIESSTDAIDRAETATNNRDAVTTASVTASTLATPRTPAGRPPRPRAITRLYPNSQALTHTNIARRKHACPDPTARSPNREHRHRTRRVRSMAGCGMLGRGQEKPGLSCDVHRPTVTARAERLGRGRCFAGQSAVLVERPGVTVGIGHVAYVIVVVPSVVAPGAGELVGLGRSFDDHALVLSRRTCSGFRSC